MLDFSQQNFSGIVFPINGRELASLLRVSKVLEADSSIIYLLRHTQRSFGRNRISNWTQGLLDRFPENWSDISSSGNAWLMAGTTFAGTCYGGLHLIAWANQFPSYTESVIWRAASITILATGPMIAVLWIIVLSANSIIRSLYTTDIGRSTIRYLVYFIIALLLLWYMLCRTFIVVECFILLARIPQSALRVPTWAAYVPSFS